jgi:hypothetical protein
MRARSGAKCAQGDPVRVDRTNGDLPRAPGEDSLCESIRRLVVDRKQIELRTVCIRRRAECSTLQLHRDEPDEPAGTSRCEETQVSSSECRSPGADPAGMAERGGLCLLGQLLPLLCERPESVSNLDGERRRRMLAQADVAVDKRPRMQPVPRARV